MTGLTYAERTAVRLAIDQRRREFAFEEEAVRFVRITVGGRRGVTRDRLLSLKTRGELTVEQIDRAIARLSVAPDAKGMLRFPAETGVRRAA
jgi:hypothetical protein